MLQNPSFDLISVSPTTGALGADVTGIDLAKPIPRATFAELKQAMLTYQVLYIRDQDLSPEEYIKFAKRWGGIYYYPYMTGHEAHPEIFEVIKNPGEARTFGNRWHTDQMYSTMPCKYTILYAQELPSLGGDTMFSNTYAAFEALSPGMQKMALKLNTYNDGNDPSRYDGKSRQQYYSSNRMGGKLKKVKKGVDVVSVHPLVRTHPETGRNALYIGDQTVSFDGMSTEESVPLYEFFIAHLSKPEFTCRMRWEPGSLAIWDNRCVCHYAVSDYPTERRLMHRITIKDTERPKQV
ncbi:MAG TPA: taurine dioxygenase [Rhodospirillaceae bacterium]|nr:taurine dioxygenase [Rhodospirillaceae bacterium]HAA91613.1 taurine dioxygenase [Rhodospirillaceae bacterium]HAT35246.1 taurine dioxygenase [Rhodospirillaceae bacterium]